eukprot:9482243-Pyramimonas_sp.AAC.1
MLCCHAAVRKCSTMLECSILGKLSTPPTPRSWISFDAPCATSASVEHPCQRRRHRRQAKVNDAQISETRRITVGAST